MRYRVTVVNFPGTEKTYEHVTIDEVLELMTKFKNDHPRCYMFRPYGLPGSSSLTGMNVNENGNIHGLIVEMEEG